uniref:Uncharacterized protein n=1 Tax=Candidatus Kentrum sp. LPFa TaxID=2126335 RepID=A0A450X4S7_9GAMM|nr:MAG: hypothetical protein BECKLPF1236A_GA0070988_100856 [Candidatus Kentron sp. LPFa]VFK24287.1 MAG: hypothetical protein BECKLPF1236C_GA0070990_100127 [Candidatus Kentron sp. LPFa]
MKRIHHLHLSVGARSDPPYKIGNIIQGYDARSDPSYTLPRRGIMFMYRKKKNPGKVGFGPIPLGFYCYALTDKIAERVAFGFMFSAQLYEWIKLYKTSILLYQYRVMLCRFEAKLR